MPTISTYSEYYAANDAWLNTVSAHLTQGIAKNLVQSLSIPEAPVTRGHGKEQATRQVLVRWRHDLVAYAQHDTPSKRLKVVETVLKYLAMSPIRAGQLHMSDAIGRDAMLTVLVEHPALFPRPVWLDELLKECPNTPVAADRYFGMLETRRLNGLKKNLSEKIQKAGILSADEVVLLKRFLG